MDDRRIGLVIRGLRRRRGWRQSDLGAASHVSQTTISAVERGHLDTLSVRTFRQILAALDARGELEVRWRGGQLDRMLDEDHALLVGRVVEVLERYGWETAIEVTYAVFGDRGSIDVLGFHRPTGSLLVIEVKTQLTSVEETLRRHDEKVRLANRVAADRFGWRASTTSQLLVIAETRTARGSVQRHARVLDAALPAENVAVRRWLAAPSGRIRGRWFLPISDPRAAIPRLGGGDRVRVRVRTDRAISPRSD
jgi:transcriptional regulator with XRE-family HTH domain